MTHSCSQCSFTCQFASALIMHRQMVHGVDADILKEVKSLPRNKHKVVEGKSDCSTKNFRDGVHSKGLFRTNSALKFFDKIRTRISGSKQSICTRHEEEDILPEPSIKSEIIRETALESPMTSRSKTAYKLSQSFCHTPTLKELSNERFKCHLCSFVADRITVLDRHLLNDHQIGLTKLLELVMAKTREGVFDNKNLCNDSYYTELDIKDDCPFFVETVSPKVKVFKHTTTNTDLHWRDIVERKPNDKKDENDLLKRLEQLNNKMNECVESSNNLTKHANESKTTVDSKKYYTNSDLFKYHLMDAQDRKLCMKRVMNVKEAIEVCQDRVI